MAAATFLHRSIKIGDGKDLDTNGQKIIGLAAATGNGEAARFEQITVSNSGTFSGNGGSNFAIAHGMSKTPRFVFIIPTDINGYFGMIHNGNQTDYGNTHTAVTQADATNFYVSGVKMNPNGVTQSWVAFS